MSRSKRVFKFDDMNDTDNNVADISAKTVLQMLHEDYADIAPYDDTQFHERLEAMTREPGFEHAIRYIMPDVDFEMFCRNLLSIKNQNEFQVKVMGKFLTDLEKATSDGITFDGVENVDPAGQYTFISNHRDIVLDASFLNLSMIRADRSVAQVAIGNNLLIYEWITDLVKLNRSFIVKRDVRRLEALEAARKLSSYIHFAITRMKESVWIAQREGRAKDSNDRTQESLIKMLALAGDGDVRGKLLDINLLPVSISYELDPNDYLKVKEFLLKRRDPEFKKSQRDDLLSMETGLLGNKGRIHFHFGPCINNELAAIVDNGEHGAMTRAVCRLIDRTIHAGYKLFPGNLVAYDVLEKTDRFVGSYTDEDKSRFLEYIDGQLKKVDVSDISDEERDFMFETILSMYANPVRNQLAAL